MEPAIPPARPGATLGVFERSLTVWVALRIVAGIVLVGIVPAPFQICGLSASPTSICPLPS